MPFKWSPASAMRKAVSDVTIGVNAGIVSVSKQIGPNDDKRDAYRNCSKCNKHINYHRNGECPK